MGSVSAASSNRMPLSPAMAFRWSILFLRTASGMPLGKASQVGKLFRYVRLSLCLYRQMEHKGNVSTNGWRFIPPPPWHFWRLLSLPVAYFIMTWQVKSVSSRAKMDEGCLVLSQLSKPPYKGIHSVYSGFNQAFREYFNKSLSRIFSYRVLLEIVRPPSTTRTMPVMKRASSEARKRAAWPISQPVPSIPSGDARR